MKKYLIHISLFLVMLIVFTIIYKNILGNWNDAFYTSAMIQTLSGIPTEPESAKLKTVESIQSLLSYMLITGIIIWILHSVNKNH